MRFSPRTKITRLSADGAANVVQMGQHMWLAQCGSYDAHMFLQNYTLITVALASIKGKKTHLSTNKTYSGSKKLVCETCLQLWFQQSL
jgi:hypothetical protein